MKGLFALAHYGVMKGLFAVAGLLAVNRTLHALTCFDCCSASVTISRSACPSLWQPKARSRSELEMACACVCV
jgi:hypothetical protein